MINRRLIKLMGSKKHYIYLTVILNLLALISNTTIMILIAGFINRLYLKQIAITDFASLLLIMTVLLLCRFVLVRYAGKMSYHAAGEVKIRLREAIFNKLLQLGPSYDQHYCTSNIIQIANEGVDQLEIYFESYLPQFFYAMIAPMILAVIIAFIDLKVALTLLICVPLIPLSIVLIQKIAKRLLSRYWSDYSTMADTFLENLEGLETLKIYQADEYKQQKMNEEAEKFRKITMKVLIMQLNSITVMDIVAYGGAGLAIALALFGFVRGEIDLFGMIVIILLGADYFIPMRVLGSYFHIAMNGMAAADKIFSLLDLSSDTQNKIAEADFQDDILVSGLNFKYGDKPVLSSIDLNIPANELVAIVGGSGSGKTTIARILSGQLKYDTGSIRIGKQELKTIADDAIAAKIAYLSHDAHLFKGTIAENLRIADELATDELLWSVLKRVDLATWVKDNGGLNYQLNERGSNLSGGQRQRLAMARLLLKAADVYIFDEATSNIDIESETIILQSIYDLADKHTVIMIAHRLANVEKADMIYLFQNGQIAESGSHDQLMMKKGSYYEMVMTQRRMEDLKEVNYETD